MSVRSASKAAGIEQRLFSAVFALASLGLLAFFVYLVAVGKEGQFLTLVAAIVALVGSRASDIVSLKLGAEGLSTELERQIDQAQTTLKEFQILATTWATLTTELAYGAGRWDGLSRKAKTELTDRISSTLKAIGVRADDAVHNIAFRYDHFDYAQAIFQADSLPSDPDWSAAWNAHQSAHSGIGGEAGPDEIEELFRSHNRLTDEVREALEDYRFFESTRQHRRMED